MRVARCAAITAIAVLIFCLPFILGKSSNLKTGANVLSAATLSSHDIVDLNGSAIDPFRPKSGRLKVFFFVATECPISNRYAPEVRRYCEEFGSQGVDFFLVYSSPDTTPEEIRRHMKEFSYPCAALRDLKHELVRKACVRVTPECAVFTIGGQLVYHGRIDNQNPDFGKMRPAPTQRELQTALETLLRGGLPVCATMPGIGCRIPDLQ